MNTDKENYETLLPSNPKWLKDHTILFARIGSHAYGTATETSDSDYKGICVPPTSYFLGLDSFEGYDKTGGKNFKNTSEDIDITIIHINKFVRDAMAGVPNNLELLFLEPEDYLYMDKYGTELIKMRQHFLSKQIMKKFGGYAKSQAQRMKHINPTSAARNELVERYGYDTKNYMHTVRLLESAIQILNYHTFEVKRKGANRLIALREGLHTLDEALATIDALEVTLQCAYEQTTLRNQPDREFINNWLVSFNERYLADKRI